MTRRVVVTGMGVVTALGCDVADFWERICAGKSGVGPLKRFQTTDFKVTFGGEIRDFNAEEHLEIEERASPARPLRSIRHGCRSQGDPGIGNRPGSGDPYRHGTLIGSGIGGSARNRRAALQAVRTGPFPRLPLHDSQADRQRGQRKRLDPLGPSRAQQCRRDRLRHRRPTPSATRSA